MTKRISLCALAVCLFAAAGCFGQSVHNGDLSVSGRFDVSTGISSKPFTITSSDPNGTCSAIGWTQLNTGSGATGGDLSVCVNGTWSVIAGPGLGSYTPPFTGGVAQPLSALVTSRVIYAASFGVSPNNATNDTQLANAMKAAYDPNNPGQANPTDIILPCGTLQFASQIQPPPLTRLIGCARGDSKQLISPRGNGTVLQATSTFSGKSFPDNMLVMMGGNGALSTAYFGVRLENLSIDANGYGGGLMVANCQEMCSADRLLIENFTNYGFFDWGANNNGNNSTANAPWGLPASYQGSGNDGPYTNFEFYPYGAATATTVPFVLANVAGLRGFNSFTVATQDPTQNSGVHSPNYCGMIWGNSATVANGHCEGTRDGVIVGPGTGAPQQFGDGAKMISLTNIQASTPQISTGCAVRLQQPKGVTLIGTSGGQTAAICNDQNSTTSNAAFYVADYNVGTNAFPTISSRDGLNLDSSITTSATITGGSVIGGSLHANSTSPCSVLQYSGGVTNNFCLNTNGDLVITAGNGANGDAYFQGNQTLAFGAGSAKSGLNLSAPLDSTNNVMSFIGNNLYYLPGSDTYMTGSNGQSDANGLIFDQSSMRFVGTLNTAAGTSLTPSQVNGWTSFQLNNNGTSAFGNIGLAGAVTTFTNGSGNCTLNPSVSGLTCSSDQRLKKNIQPLSGGLQIVQALSPVTYNWKAEGDGAAAHPGFIAQAVQQLVPAAVVPDRSGYLQLNPDVLIPYLVQSIKDLSAEVEQLKAQLATKK